MSWVKTKKGFDFFFFFFSSLQSLKKEQKENILRTIPSYVVNAGRIQFFRTSWIRHLEIRFIFFKYEHDHTTHVFFF